MNIMAPRVTDADTDSLDSVTCELVASDLGLDKLKITPSTENSLDKSESFASCASEYDSYSCDGLSIEPHELPLRIRDLSVPENAHEVFANTRSPFVVNNDTCEGAAILKVRTTPDDYYAPYFNGKKRMFEVMIQGKLKHVTENDRIYIGIECDKVELSGFWANAAATVVFKLVECTTANAHCTLGDDENPCCQLVFPLDTTADRLCSTPPGQQPPPLGIPMFDDKYSKANRPKHMEFNTTDTYSLSMHSMYVDLVEWKLVNLPGISYICLDAFLRNKSLRFVAYAIPKDHVGPHIVDVKRYIFNFEIDNVNRQKST